MEKGLNDWSCCRKPVLVIFPFEFFSCPLPGDFKEPFVHGSFRQQSLKGLDHFQRFWLEAAENLEALMVETINAVLVCPMIITLFQKFSKSVKVSFEICEKFFCQWSFIGFIPGGGRT